VVEKAVGFVVVPKGDVEVVVSVYAVEGYGFYGVPCIVGKTVAILTCLVFG
jgi:hypothetical protein